jgi:hypothetical protein
MGLAQYYIKEWNNQTLIILSFLFSSNTAPATSIWTLHLNSQIYLSISQIYLSSIVLILILLPPSLLLILFFNLDQKKNKKFANTTQIKVVARLGGEST